MGKIIDIIGITCIELIHILICVECFNANIILGLFITTFELIAHFIMYISEIKKARRKYGKQSNNTV